jgi:hypothetical protein
LIWTSALVLAWLLLDYPWGLCAFAAITLLYSFGGWRLPI